MAPLFNPFHNMLNYTNDINLTHLFLLFVDENEDDDAHLIQYIKKNEENKEDSLIELLCNNLEVVSKNFSHHQSIYRINKKI